VGSKKRILFLILKGFNEIIAIRLPKQTVKKASQLNLVPSLHSSQNTSRGTLGLSKNFSKVLPIIPFLWKKHFVLIVHLGTLGTNGTKAISESLIVK
jgi:hypothetical protein